MATKKLTTPQLKSWSFSRYRDYVQCPLKFKLKYLDKITEPPNAAMARGSEIHTMAEKYLKGELSRLPAELKAFKDELVALKKMAKKKILGAIVEETWALTESWDRTAWNDWANCWLRVKLDVGHFEENGDTLVITDWKTGKLRPEKNEEYIEQLDLYALSGFLLYDHVKDIYVRLGYVDQGIWYPDKFGRHYTRDQVEQLKKVWVKRVVPMFKDRRFAPRPNNLCNWCFYRASNKANGGGQCKF